ncbi:exosome complex protein Rrp42 [Pyrobaculum aerophilum]|uniref:Exosome complex component Rrp42 n=1 Tax=Pyrobaculum aerophilum TaxID=13773 RepID=A0A371QX75_9CREN|nr:exosome complex protein Rrp42 [Pyrobaculum aerophilum]RFA94637.1 exonuclease [Pyrobaculum aerophilum]RFA95004.1 exonuclease [Pyrobaculum aerophilum]
MASISPYGKRFISYLRREQIRRLLATKYRVDGRGPEQTRNVEINVGVVKTADGSAEVKLGKTHVVAGVKVGLGQPFPDAPDEGVLVVNAEVLPHASPYTEVGPPDEFAIELARVVDRGIRHCGYVDFKKLAVEGGKAYVLWIDLYVINDDGNLIDAANLASVAALKNTQLPVVVKDEAGVVKLDRNNKAPLPVDISKAPIAVSVGKIGNVLFLDPTFEEELSLDGRITFTFSEDKIVAAQKTLGYFTQSEIEAALNLALRGRDRLLEALKNALK